MNRKDRPKLIANPLPQVLLQPASVCRRQLPVALLAEPDGAAPSRPRHHQPGPRHHLQPAQLLLKGVAPGHRQLEVGFKATWLFSFTFLFCKQFYVMLLLFPLYTYYCYLDIFSSTKSSTSSPNATYRSNGHSFCNRDSQAELSHSDLRSNQYSFPHRDSHVEFGLFSRNQSFCSRRDSQVCHLHILTLQSTVCKYV